MDTFIVAATKQFKYYKMLADKAIAQVAVEQLSMKIDHESNSIAVIMKHMHGNMLSRWTDFLTGDGEKPWRNRDREFEDEGAASRESLLKKWEEGWECLFHAIAPLTDSDLERVIYIRNEGHTVQEAILRQLAHYSYHVGQIVFLARHFAGPSWSSLTIPKGESGTYNNSRFSKPQQRKHFTDDLLEKTSEDTTAENKISQYDERRKLIERWLYAWSVKDIELLLLFYHEGAIYSDPFNPNGIVGLPSIKAYFSRLLNHPEPWAWYSEETFDHPSLSHLKWRVEFNDGGSLKKVYGVDIIEFKGLQIVRNEVFFDTKQFAPLLNKPSKA